MIINSESKKSDHKARNIFLGLTMGVVIFFVAFFLILSVSVNFVGKELMVPMIPMILIGLYLVAIILLPIIFYLNKKQYIALGIAITWLIPIIMIMWYFVEMQILLETFIID